jgi:hypothetical protein
VSVAGLQQRPLPKAPVQVTIGVSGRVLPLIGLRQPGVEPAAGCAMGAVSVTRWRWSVSLVALPALGLVVGVLGLRWHAPEGAVPVARPDQAAPGKERCGARLGMEPQSEVGWIAGAL